MLSRAMSNYAPSTDDPFLPSNFTEPRASDLSFSSHVRSSAVEDSNALYTNAGSRKDPTMTDYQTASFGGGNQDQRNFSSNATNAYGLYQQQPQPHTQLYDGKSSALRRGYNDVGGYSQPASNQRYDASQYAPWQPISQHQQHPRPGQGYGTTTPDALSNYMRSMNVIDDVDTGKPASAMAAYDQQAMHQPVNSAVATNAAGGEERYSRKVFVGGLPPDIDEDEIHSSFLHFGEHSVDWPHKIESKSCFPPKGYCFLIFNFEESVHGLIQSCKIHGDKYLIDVSSPTMKNKEVQIRPWRLADADFVLGAQLPLDPRKTVFVGGVPRPLKAIEIAMILDRLYGGVCYAGIDTDPELKYPKGAGRVSFSNQQSYISAISARFVHLQHADIDKKVEVKPYVLDDQPCDECNGARCMGKVAPYFCQNVTCLQYYCEHCWNLIHSKAGREFHKPLIKEGSDRPKLQSGVQQHTQQQAAQVTGGASGVSAADPSSVGYY